MTRMSVKIISFLCINFLFWKSTVFGQIDDGYDSYDTYPTHHPTTFKPTHNFPTNWPTPAVGSSTHACSEDSRNYAYSEEVNTKFLPGIEIKYIEDLKFITITDGPPIRTYTILLYHCNYPDRHALETLGYRDIHYIYQIPFLTVAYTKTYFSHILEVLNLRSAATVSATPLMWNTSPCFIQLYANGYIVNAFDDNPNQVNHILKENDVDATFGTETQVHNGLFRGVPVPSIWYNSTALEQAESLLKYFSVFFNAEEVVKEVVDTLSASYECSSITAQKAPFQKVFRGRSIMWCDYAGKRMVSNVPRGPQDPHLQQQGARVENIWRCPSCPSPECSLVVDSGARFLNYKDYGITTFTVNNTEFMSTTEFMEMSVYADYWVTTGDPFVDFNVTLHQLLKEDPSNRERGILPLEMIPAVQNGRVFDWKKKGPFNPVQMSAVEPDTLLQDLITIIRQINHKRVWLRNIFEERIRFDIGTCVGNPWGSQALQSTVCSTLSGSSDSVWHRISGLSSQSTPEDVRSVLTQIGVGLLMLGGFGLLASLIYHYAMNKNQANSAARRALGKDAKKMNTSIGGGSKRGKKKSLFPSVVPTSDTDGSLSYERTFTDSSHPDSDTSMQPSKGLYPIPFRMQQIPVVPVMDSRVSPPPGGYSKSWNFST